MFNCSHCGSTSKSCEKPVRVTVQKREKEYPERPYARDKGGFGHEIVREAVVCFTCSLAYSEPEVEAAPLNFEDEWS